MCILCGGSGNNGDGTQLKSIEEPVKNHLKMRRVKEFLARSSILGVREEQHREFAPGITATFSLPYEHTQIEYLRAALVDIS